MNRIIPDSTPPDPDEAISAHTSAFERARAMLRTAQTQEAVDAARFWMTNANREIARWQARKAETTQ